MSTPMVKITYLFLNIVVFFLRPILFLYNSARQGQLIAGFLHSYRSRASDLFVVSYPKSGTTWMQMILYQLTTEGNLDFVHLAAVSPCLEEMPTVLIPDAEEMPSPRIFKSHLRYKLMPRGSGKYIYVVRNGSDVAVSYYHHYVSFNRYTGSFEQFMKLFLAGRVSYGSWFKHVSSWLARRADPNVLFVQYEDLIDDLEGTIRKVAKFCDLDVPDSAYPRILERCGFDYMKKHQQKFDLANGLILNAGLQVGNFIRKGRPKQGKVYLDEVQERAYRQAVARHLGANPAQAFGLSALKLPRDV